MTPQLDPDREKERDAKKQPPVFVEVGKGGAAPTSPVDGKMRVFVDGRTVVVDPGATLYDACVTARRDVVNAGQPAPPGVPVLCHRPHLGLNPVAVCRVCLVDVMTPEGNRAVASCMRQCKEGDVITSTSRELLAMRKTLVELLLAEHPSPCARHAASHDCELEVLGEKMGLRSALPAVCDSLEKATTPTQMIKVSVAAAVKEEKLSATLMRRPEATLFAKREQRMAIDESNPTMLVDHNACILCDRCSRACEREQPRRIISRVGKGSETTIGFDCDQDMWDSDCVNCGWCMSACPTGAITYREATQVSSGQPGAANVVALSRSSSSIMSDLCKLDPVSNDLTDEMNQYRRLRKPLTYEEVCKLPLFAARHLSSQFVKRSLGGVTIATLKKGMPLCKQGRPGHTAFYVVKGSVDVMLEPAITGAPQTHSTWGRLLSRAKASDDHEKRARSRRGAIPVDANVEITPGQWLAELPAGEVFGENSCINGTPRSATVRAAQDGTIVIEMLRNFLEILRRDPKFRAELDAKHRRRCVHTHLRSTPWFRDLPHDYLESLVDRVTLVTYAPGQTIVREGDPAGEALYLVRLGSVGIMKQLGREMVTINYLSAGECLGEVEMLGVVDATMARGVVTATSEARGNVELVRIGRDVFEEIVKKFPDVKRRLTAVAESRVIDLNLWPVAHSPSQPMLREYFRQELNEGQSLLVMDLERCTRCDECVKACSDAHHGIARLKRDGERIGKYLIPTSCRSCRDPRCLRGCPVDAIHRRKGLAIVIENHCVGCGNCAKPETGCPYGNIFMEPVWRMVPSQDGSAPQPKLDTRAVVCDLDNCRGETETPACVHACPHDAAFRIDGPDFLTKLIEENTIGSVNGHSKRRSK